MPTPNKNEHVTWKTMLSWLDSFVKVPAAARQALAADLALVLNGTVSWQHRIIVTAVEAVLAKPEHAAAAAPFPGAFSIESLCRFMTAFVNDPEGRTLVPEELLMLRWGKPTTAVKYLQTVATIPKIKTEIAARRQRELLVAERTRKRALAESAKAAKAAAKEAKPVQQELPLQAPDLVSLALTVTGLRKEVTTHSQQIAGSYKRESSQNLRIEEALRRIAWLEEQLGTRAPAVGGPIIVTEVKAAASAKAPE